MAPRRKKSKQSSHDQDPDSTQSDNTLPHKSPPVPTSQHKPQESGSEDKKAQSNPSASPPTPTQQADKRASWYKGGSWRSKASPVAQATRESISVAGGATSESLSEAQKPQGRYVHSSLRRSTKSIPSISTESIVHATGTNAGADKPKFFSDNLGKSSVDLNKGQVKQQQDDIKDTNDNKPEQVKELDMKTDKAHVKASAATSDSTNLKPLPTDDANSTESQQSPPEPPLPPEPTKDAASGWWGWWSRPDGYNDNKAQEDRKDASSTPLPATPEERPTGHGDMTAAPLDINKTMHSMRSIETTASSRSWFGLWSNSQIQQQAEQQEGDAAPKDAPSAEPPTESPQPTVEATTKDAPAPEIKQGQETPQNKSSGWAFWSRAQANDESSTPNGTQRQVGELAVADTPSQSHPEAAQFNEQRQQKPKSTRIGRSDSVKSTAALSSSSQPHLAVSDATKVPDAPKNVTDAKAARPQLHPNLVIPSFDESYCPAYIPSYRERLTTYVASTLRLIDTPTAPRHVSITSTPPKIKNAIAIGVHGYFPAPLIQKVLGQPTGTSIRFANYASTAVRDWVEANQPETACEIETVALEGEGFIADRVATLWKLLLNWLSHLRQADLILVACHSQGVPVAIMLVHKLLQLGCLSPHARIGICAMAGVNLGPFADYKSRLLGAGAAAELFEFSRQESRVSTEYKAALDGVLRHGVRITYCGSIDDQLVSLEVCFRPLCTKSIY